MGDTNYYMISTPLLPMLIPLQLFVPTPLLKVIDALLRVLVELGYDRVTRRVPRPTPSCSGRR
jgi:hypothetical protein